MQILTYYADAQTLIKIRRQAKLYINNSEFGKLVYDSITLMASVRDDNYRPYLCVGRVGVHLNVSFPKFVRWDYSETLNLPFVTMRLQRGKSCTVTFPANVVFKLPEPRLAGDGCCFVWSVLSKTGRRYPFDQVTDVADS